MNYEMKKEFVDKTTIAEIILFSIFALFCYNNADYDNYKLIFEHFTKKQFYDSGVVDLGFFYLCRFFSGIGFSFDVFRGVYIWGAICIFVCAVEYFCKQKTNVLLLYFLFPFALDVAQMRHFMAVSMVLYGIRYLESNNKAKFVFFVLLASTQHSIAVLYLFLLMSSLNLKTLYKSVIIITTIEFVFILLFSNYLSQYMIYSRFSGYNTFSSYSLQLALLYMLMGVGIVIYNTLFIPIDDQRDLLLSKLVVCSMLFIPLIMFNENMARLYRGLIVLIYCRLMFKTRLNEISIMNIIPFLFCVVLFYIHLSPHNMNHWKGVFLPLFENNILLNCFHLL